MKLSHAVVVLGFFCLLSGGPPEGGLYVLNAQAQTPAPGRSQFENRCGVCHGGDGNGGEYAPAMVAQLAARTDPQLATLIREGLPARGMPGSPTITDAELSELTQFLRTLRPRAAPPRAAVAPIPKVKLELTDGRTVEGVPLNHGVADDVQLRTDAGQIQLLRKSGTKFRPVTSGVNWASHDGSLTGNRYTTLAQINKGNVARLAPKWMYTIQNTNRLEVTPVVFEGIM
jgi:alcohol dehydrogenase (cytochrome c)